MANRASTGGKSGDLTMDVIDLDEQLRELAKGNATQADLARPFNVSRSTISRLTGDDEQRKAQ